MNPWKLKLSQLRALLAVAEYGNFSEAALQMDLTQSTVSHAIATLEDELGVMVFHRGHRGAQLTPVGERILHDAQKIQGLLENMMSAAEHERGLKGGTVRIGTFRSIATHLLPETIARLHQVHGTVQISIIEMDELYQLRQALRQGQVDLCFAEMLEGKEFETIHILDDEYIALLPPQFGLRDAQLTIEDLYKYPLISSSHDSCSVRLRDRLATLEPKLELTYRIRHDSSMTGMVQQGLGIALMTELAAKPVPEGVRVCRLPFFMSRPIGATLLREGLHSPAVYAFLDALRGTGEFASAQAG